MGDQISVAMAFFVTRLQPIWIPTAISVYERVLPRKRRIPHKRIEPAILTRKNFGKLNLPVKRGNGVWWGVEAIGGELELVAGFEVDWPASCRFSVASCQ